ncbi:hypothetical protein SAMN05444380_1242 [Thermophagus xiamenensis]|jgi:hypothetical protein|uniref:Uncharacterized protein n=1 Tax=Thermophagus xiamenensis TaxID=385682 RepID=A0A1I2ERR9_9BACT|nr:hypothetical protein SAMN05444380_1242 [Thermophagus xiamenensis]
MIIEIKKPISASKVREIGRKLSSRRSNQKTFDPKKYFNTINWKEKPTEIQKKMRDEWE